MTAKWMIFLGASLTALGVGLGAFGAHALKPKLEANGYLSTFETGVQYHFIHSLGLLILGVICLKFPNFYLAQTTAYLFAVGILLFSCSLYVLSVSGIKWLGAITPFGGLCFIIAWILVALGALKTSF